MLPLALLFSAMFIAMLPVVQTETILVPDDPTRDQGLLDFLNDQVETNETVLDIDCAIRSDSAKHIIKHRDGKDKTPFTADDDLFDSVQEVDNVKMVGSWTIDQLITCAQTRGYYNVAAPTLLSPANGAELANNEWYTYIVWHFSWEPVQDATNYRLQIFSPDSITPIYDRTNVWGSAFNHYMPWLVSEENRIGWSWQVQANSNGVWGDWSETRSFDVAPPTDVQYLDNNISGLDPALQAVIIDLKAFADSYVLWEGPDTGDPYGPSNDVYANTQLGEVTIYSHGGVAFGYGVRYYEHFELGISFSVDFGLDENYNLVYEFADMG